MIVHPIQQVYSSTSKLPWAVGYVNSNWAGDKDDFKSTTGYAFMLGGAPISWFSKKQPITTTLTMKAKNVAASMAAKEAVWLRNFLVDLTMVPSLLKSITMYCDNTEAVANLKEPRVYKSSKHIHRKYHLIWSIVKRWDIAVTKIASADNLVDPFTKSLPAKVFDDHVEGMGVRYMAI